MPSVLTGAALANRDLIYLGVSGDGDSASIGLGQFAHALRRGVNMTYIVENNGVYGLTKGQFSATADKGSKSKKGVGNQDSPIDLVSMAILLGATYVARSFSGDKRQLVPLIKAAIEHKGAAFIDCVSPAWPSTTTRFDEELRLRARPQRGRERPRRDRGPRRDHGRLRARHRRDRDPARRLAPAAAQARRSVRSDRQARRHDLPAGAPGGRRDRHGPSLRQPDGEDLHDRLGTVRAPLNALGDAELCPGSAALEKLNAGLR
jgi:2-oxoglutarate ferredoxin oxidoreductase subunit beta